MNGGLLGGAGPPPQSTMQPSGFLEVDRRLRTLASYYRNLAETETVRMLERVISGFDKRVEQLFIQFGGQASQLHARPPDWTLANDAYAIVRKTASQADRGSDELLANALRESLLAINKHADDAWKAVAGEYDIADARIAQRIGPPRVPLEPHWTVAAIPPPTRIPMEFDWDSNYRQLRNLSRGFRNS